MTDKELLQQALYFLRAAWLGAIEDKSLQNIMSKIEARLAQPDGV